VEAVKQQVISALGCGELPAPIEPEIFWRPRRPAQAARHPRSERQGKAMSKYRYLPLILDCC